jgi:hypothetical protein
MRLVRLCVAAALLACAGAAQATTIVIFVEPMTFERYARVYDTPGRDRLLMCMAPPAEAGCTELPLRKRR